jgi:hypothetical protein
MRQRKAKRPSEPRHLRARAYNDAVRDILRVDGVFRFSDQRHATIWEWNGVNWRRVALAAFPSQNGRLVALSEDEAVAGAR